MKNIILKSSHCRREMGSERSRCIIHSKLEWKGISGHRSFILVVGLKNELMRGFGKIRAHSKV